MLTLVIGTGYTGGRLLGRLDNAFGLSRSRLESSDDTADFDLDTAASLPIHLPDVYRVIYTVPPAGDSNDERLQRFLELLDPAPKALCTSVRRGFMAIVTARRLTSLRLSTLAPLLPTAGLLPNAS